MNNWQQEWNQFIETIASDVEWCLHAVSAQVDDALDQVEQSVDEGIQKCEDALSGWLSENEEVVEELDAIVRRFEAEVEQAWMPVGQTIDPILNEHSACVGCRNYHGQIYGQVPLVCAMHPYGWTVDNDCPDWESTWSHLSQKQ